MCASCAENMCLNLLWRAGAMGMAVFKMEMRHLHAPETMEHRP